MKLNTLSLLILLLATPISAAWPWAEGFELDMPQLSAIGLWIEESELTCIGSTCWLALEPWRDVGGQPICNYHPFYGLPRARSGRGGFLVGADLFLTVHEVTQAECASRAVVFGYAASGWQDKLLAPIPMIPEEPPIDLDQPELWDPSTANFETSIDDIAYCAEVVAGGSTQGWTLVRLDRPMVQKSIKMERRGQAGDWFAIAGYPERTPLKLALSSSPTGGHVLDGSSGSLVLDLNSHRAHSIVWSGDTSWLDSGSLCARPLPEIAPRSQVSVPDLSVIPPLGLEIIGVPMTVTGPEGGPFTPSEVTVILEVTGPPAAWVARRRGGWLAPAEQQGTVTEGDPHLLTFTLGNRPFNVPPGTYPLGFTVEDLDYVTIDLFQHVLIVTD